MENLFEISINVIKPSNKKLSSDLSLFYGNTKEFSLNTAMMYAKISTMEQKRADKFIFASDRENYIISHYILNKQLSKTLGIPIESLSINFENNRKPFIANSLIDFNLSHSKNYYCFGIIETMHGQIGVDIEKIEELRDLDSIVNNYMHVDEKKYINESTLTSKEQLIRFYEIWTRKEAFLKMIGIGIITNLKEINMSPDNKIISAKYMQNINMPFNKITICTQITDEFVMSISSNLSDIPKYIKINNM